MSTQYIRYPAANSYGSFVLNGSTSGSLTFTVPATVTSYALVWPAAQGGADTFLKNDGAGNLSWAAGSGGGGGFDSIGTFDAGVASIDGLNATGTTLFAQSADETNPGMINTGAQSFAGDKTFTGHILNSALTPNRAVITFTGGLLTTAATTSTELGYVSGVTSSIQTQLNGKQATLSIGDLTAAGTDGIVVTSGTGAVIGAGTSLAQHVADSTHNGYLSSVDWSAFNGKQAAGNYITALTGDAAASGPGSAAITLATVNSNVGSFGSSTAIPSVTVNAKGLVTAASTSVVVAPAGTLTGATLASNVLASSLTSVGTIANGVWNGTTIALANGGTGQTTKAAAFDALSPMTTGGDIIYGGASGTGTRLANGSAGQYLKSVGGTSAPLWASFTAPTVQKFLTGSGTYTTPAGVLYIKVQMVGGGGAGAGGGPGAGNGTTGGNTTFGTTLLVANGGAGATAGNSTLPPAGGTASLGSGPIGTALQGGSGSGGSSPPGTTGQFAGMPGAASPFGGAGGGATSASTIDGLNAIANTGSGGGGAAAQGSNITGSSGAAGGYVDAIITSPLSSYAYTVGAASTGGIAGTSSGAGGNGASGQIIVWEYYQ